MSNRIVICFFYLFSFVFSREESTLSRPFISFAGAKFTFYQNGESSNKYIWIHGDEQTAKMALEYHFDKYGGIAFFIQSETREIPFQSTIIDPNRIFSRDGAYHALKKFKPDWHPKKLKSALDSLDIQRCYFLDMIMPFDNALLISVHNNFRGYNINREKDRSQRVSIKSDQNPRDFIICTNTDDFEKLSIGPYNVVLQNRFPEKDDGSLSWEALRRDVRYLNIETRLGYLQQQKKMLEFVEKNLN